MPYTCEASLSQALEPSLLYHFHPDREQCVVQDDEDTEPTHIQIDAHCLDRYKGPDNFAAKRSTAESPDKSQMYDVPSKMS